jgi:4-amino-4-deoxy-L-arabinose transferase-like glycosyltransferase
MSGRLADFPAVFFPRLSYDGITPQRVELEFPFLPYLTACTWALFGQADLWGRVWAILFSLWSVVGIYRLGSALFNERSGLWAAAIYAVIPLGVFYGRVMMPEAIAQAFTIWALDAAARWRARAYGRVWIPGLWLGLAVLSKLPQLMIWPVGVCLVYFGLRQDKQEAGYGNKEFYRRCLVTGVVYGLVSLGLPMLYYSWVHVGSVQAGRFASGILQGQVIHAQIPWLSFAKLTAHTLLYLSGVLLVTAFNGLARLIRAWTAQPRSASALCLFSGLAVLYVGGVCLAIPLDYYLTPVLPLLALLAAHALEGMEIRVRTLTALILMGLLLLRLGTVEMSGKYAVQNAYQTQALWLREHTARDAVLVLSAGEPMTFYYAQRTGFRLLDRDDAAAFAQLQQLPAQYFVKLPGDARTGQFWQEVGNRYPLAGPGVYRLEE